MADLKEQNRMSLDDEVNHWWIWTRLQFVEEVMKLISGPKKVLEFGCGTGQNLYYLRTRSKQNNSIELIRGVDPGLQQDQSANWLQGSDAITKTYPSGNEKYNLLLATDVVEHIENDVEILKEWQKHLEPGAKVLITVPAFQFLWSYQDVFLEHYRRYTKSHLKEVAEKAGLKTVRLTYAFAWALPLVFLVRKVLKRNSEEASEDLAPTNPILNFIFKVLGKIEYFFGGNPLFGTSVIGIFEVPK